MEPSHRSIVRSLLAALAAERRHIVSDWRAMVLLTRALRTTPANERTWQRAPSSTSEARALLNRMAFVGDVRPLEGLLGIYEVTVPYAEPGTAGELEVLMETHPIVMASHHTAFAFHDLTDELPKVLHATVPLGTPDQLPTGTIASDWEALPRAPARYPASILGRDVRWHRVQPRRFVGMGEYKPEGWPVRVTTPERTLIDGLLAPDDCGGMGNVLRGWARQRDLLDIDAVVELVDLLDVGVLRQRAGFVMESLGLSHSAFDRWRSKSHRGGSSRLYGGAPYAPTISEAWNLSLNVPIDALQGEAA